jgi:Ran-binding protein 9/10
MSGPSGSNSPNHNVFRRFSYASVLQRNASSTSPSLNPPNRSGSNISGSGSGSYPPPHGSHSRHQSRGMEAEGSHSGPSASWGRAGHLPSYSSHWIGVGNGLDDPKTPSFFVPSYLRGSRHAERLEEAYRAKLAAQRDSRSNHSSNAGSLSTSSSSINLHKLVPSHRGMTHDIIERAPAPVYEDTPAPLPSRWNQTDKYAGLDLNPDGLEVRYNGMSKTHEEAAAVRADHPMPRECGIYYYEVTVASKGKEG